MELMSETSETVVLNGRIKRLSIYYHLFLSVGPHLRQETPESGDPICIYGRTVGRFSCLGHSVRSLWAEDWCFS